MTGFAKDTPGPWQNEPDEVEFEHAGLKCFLCRNEIMGHWCGYVGIPKGHFLFGKDGDALEVHGGITYSELEDDLWWFGFDCAHAFDLIPGMEPVYKKIERDNPELVVPNSFRERYRDLNYVKKETESLAEQLRDADRCETKRDFL